MALSEQVQAQQTEGGVVRPSVMPSDDATRSLLVSSPQCPPALITSYRELYINVELALGARGGSVIAVASVDDSASAGLVAANLALTMAGDSYRTLLLDGNLFAPSLDRLFGGVASVGLAPLLRGDITDLRQVTLPTALPTLGVITSGDAGGHQSGLEHLGDVKATVARMKNVSDRVVFLLTPVLVGPDVLRLSGVVDGLVLVVGAGRTRRDNARRARRLLDEAGIHVLGAVIAP